MFPQLACPRARKFLVSPLLCLGLSAGLATTLGCRIERAPSRLQVSELHQAKLADHPLPILQFPNADEAQEVIARCGQPTSDTVEPVYTKYYNGPVRRLAYVGQRDVRLDFIPSYPKAELAYTEAPLPRSDNEDHLKNDATWQFQAGFFEQEQMVTAHRVGVYLPCAGEALHQGF